MPLNTLRLNAQASSHPNERIVFIKPLALPHSPTMQHQSDHETADTFLRAIAAQCLPLMKSHYLSVTTLEEHEPNKEFIGRNFNNGEIIQLVLRSKNGEWLPFNMVQMVMMHELAHNTHMNHGKAFWQERNNYAEEMKALWAKGYTGEGFWGSGRRLTDMQAVMGNNIVDSEVLRDLPVCGGTFRSRRRKRKPKLDLTWKEKRDRRIEKKFGKNGVSLGEDEDRRMMLELGKKGPVGGKPRVAQSKRGRELRAAAALARFDTTKEDVATLKREEEEGQEEGESGSDYYEELDANLDDARDINGQPLLDTKGNSMVRVCGESEEGTEAANVHIKKEMEELEGLRRYFPHIAPTHDNRDIIPRSIANGTSGKPQTMSFSPQASVSSDGETASPSSDEREDSRRVPTKVPPSILESSEPSNQDVVCPVCSLSNHSLLLICTACANVLHPSGDKDHWPCPSQQCKSTGYINAGDVRVCGLCGVRRP